MFREQVLPLVYNALESGEAGVQEAALGSVGGLCESVDYAEVQGVLFPRVAVRAPLLPVHSHQNTRIYALRLLLLVVFGWGDVG